jgi:hypothetical protein
MEGKHGHEPVGKRLPNSRDTLRYLDALHVELRDVLKELGLARKLD